MNGVRANRNAVRPPSPYELDERERSIQDERGEKRLGRSPVVVMMVVVVVGMTVTVVVIMIVSVF